MIEERDIYHFDFDSWNIFRKNGSVVSKKDIKDRIEKVRITVLEEQWRCIENYISNEEILERSNLDNLLMFMIAQKLETLKALKNGI